MKPPAKPANDARAHLQYKAVTNEVVDFHANRIRREMKISARQASPSKPEGDDEYQQLIAEDASFNARPMIAEAAYFLAEKRGFTPGLEVFDWLEAETAVETLLRSSVPGERRLAAANARRYDDNLKPV